MANYDGTRIDYSAVPAKESRDAVLASAGMLEIEVSGQVMDKVADRLEDACDRLLALYRNYPSVHAGDAAEATRAYIAKLAEPGLDGVVKFRTAAAAFRNQSEYFATVYGEMQAMPEPPAEEWRQGGKGLDPESTRANRAAAAAANKYQANTNDNLANWFQVFDPPQLTAPGAAVAAAPTAPAAVGTVGGTGGVGASAGGAGAVAASPASLDAPAVNSPPAAAAGSTAAGVVGSAPGGSAGPGPVVAPGTPGIGSGTVTAPAAKSPDGAPGSPGGGRGPVGSAPSGELSSSRVGGGLPGVITPGVPRPDAGRMSFGSAGRPGVLGGNRSLELGGPGGRGLGGGAAEKAPLAERLTARAAALAEERAARGAAAAGRNSSHMPFLPGAMGAGRGGEGRQRPEWLLEDDPESAWLGEVPEHGPGVIRAEERGHDG
ncbi:hypothetical protein GCM10009836_27300 [Pseudonocardia ailaonensis]|uniref:PE domain-containing protein n=1 Tax=Pseudonocardia ailaonensis TaxID=367279 RepID=A0ABN2N0A2_9PSEU